MKIDPPKVGIMILNKMSKFSKTKNKLKKDPLMFRNF